MPLPAHLLPLLEGRRQPHGLGELLLLWGLRPLGWLYAALGWLRALAYRRNLLPTHQPNCPVISVGNLVSGGTGKTPMTLWLVRRLQDMGWQPAIVSRGYGQARGAGVTMVSDGLGHHLPPPLAADEAALLADRLPRVPVLCTPQRHLAVTMATELLGRDLVVLDDGFQHLAMARTVNILLLDAQHPWGNGQVLPAGVLREPKSALSRAHLVVITRCPDPAMAQDLQATLARHWPQLPVVLADHRPTGWHLLGGKPVSPPPSPAMGFCGIARPDSFAHAVKESGVTLLACHPFADHHPYTREDLDNLTRQAREQGAQALVCTAKDAVKLHGLPCDLPIYYLEMDMFFPQGSAILLEEINRRLPPLPNQ